MRITKPIPRSPAWPAHHLAVPRDSNGVNLAGDRLTGLLEPLASAKSMASAVKVIPVMLAGTENRSLEIFERNLQAHMTQVTPNHLFTLLENLKLVRDPDVRNHKHFQLVLKVATAEMAQRGDMHDNERLQEYYDFRLGTRATDLLLGGKGGVVIRGLAERLEQGSIDERRLRKIFERLPEAARRTIGQHDPGPEALSFAEEIAFRTMREWCDRGSTHANGDTGMNISNFNKVAAAAAAHPHHVVEANRRTIELAHPLNPPGKWTHFKAALAHVPLFGQLGALRRARAECQDYPVRLELYKISNRQVLVGFLKSLQAEFGDHNVGISGFSNAYVEGAPLTARHVSTAIEQAKNAKQQCRALNNQTITRLLESPLAGGARMRGERDMSDVFLKRGLAMKGCSWQEAVGPAAARFITQQVLGHCTKLPEHSNGRLTNSHFVAAMNESLALYDDIQTSPGMTPEKLDVILDKASRSPTPAGAMNTARELAIMLHVDPMLNRKNPNSALCVQAVELARAHGVPAIPDAVLKSIANGQTEQVRMGCVALPSVLGCGTDVTSIVTALKPVLAGHTRRALDEHCQAIKMIASSKRLNPAQKDFLNKIANQRRMDPVQVAEYEKLAIQLSGTMEDCARCAGDPSRAVSQLLAAVSAVETSIGDMGKHGAQFWESQSLGGGDMAADLTAQFIGLAAAGVKDQDRAALLDAMSGDAMKAFVHGIRTSPSMRVSTQARMVLGLMIESLGMCGGMSQEAAVQRAKDVTRTPEAPRSSIKPALMLSVLTSDPQVLDSRGVVNEARNGEQVDSGFDQSKVLAETSQTILDAILEESVDEEHGIAQQTTTDLIRGAYCIGGEPLPGDGADAHQRLDAFFPATDIGRRMKLAVSRCMNQVGMQPFVLNCDSSAFGRSSMLLAAEPTWQAEAWPQEDGSWMVRMTHMRSPERIERPDGATELDGSGVALCSLTYHVKPSEQADAAPTIEITDSQVVFDF